MPHSPSLSPGPFYVFVRLSVFPCLSYQPGYLVNFHYAKVVTRTELSLSCRNLLTLCLTPRCQHTLFGLVFISWLTTGFGQLPKVFLLSHQHYRSWLHSQNGFSHGSTTQDAVEVHQAGSCLLCCCRLVSQNYGTYQASEARVFSRCLSPCLEGRGAHGRSRET